MSKMELKIQLIPGFPKYPFISRISSKAHILWNGWQPSKYRQHVQQMYWGQQQNLVINCHGIRHHLRRQHWCASIVVHNSVKSIVSNRCANNNCNSNHILYDQMLREIAFLWFGAHFRTKVQSRKHSICAVHNPQSVKHATEKNY